MKKTTLLFMIVWCLLTACKKDISDADAINTITNLRTEPNLSAAKEKLVAFIRSNDLVNRINSHDKKNTKAPGQTNVRTTILPHITDLEDYKSFIRVAINPDDYECGPTIIDQYIQTKITNWDDDAEMMQALVLNHFNKPAQQNFNDILSKEKWDFARTLLTTVLEKAPHTIELIKPKLKNWDADRIAALDLIILRMGVCEFLYFDTIPTKVTINEYIDLAKDYSTPQSGQFINGILDNIHKELTAEGKIHKKNFRNSIL